MSIPDASKYPTDFDDDSSLLAALKNRQVFVLKYPVGIEDLQFTVTTTIGLSVPLCITFAGGEIAFVETIDDDTFICTEFGHRGVLSTPIQPHGKGELVYLGIVSPYIKLLKLAIQATQKYQGRVGLESEKPVTCSPGERYVARDTKRIYACFVANEWTWVNVISHSDLDADSLEDDDHAAIYQDNTRASTWHGNLGTSHINNGDDHDHLSSGEGLAVRRVDGGLESSRPAVPGRARRTWFSTDLEGGTLFIAVDENTWSQISAVPAGAIMAFDGDCPSGFTRVAALNDKYLYGADTAGDTGGNANHLHDYDEVQEHYHTVDEDSDVTGSDGNHAHKFNYGNNAGTGSTIGNLCSGGTTRTTSAEGAHGHSATVGATTTDSAGSASGQTSSSDNEPASREIVWCKKD